MDELSISRVAVVVPARNEESSIGAAVAAIRRACSVLSANVAFDILVVANGCTDDTAAVASAAGARVLTCPEPNVGAARATGAAWVLSRVDDVRKLWIACTDADSVVPDHWLTTQLDAADGGADVFLGTVALAAHEEDRHQSWLGRYARRTAGEAHGHVHGANLGARGSAYVDVGGFGSLSLHEDVDLVTRLIDSGAVPAWIDRAPVITSARHHARVAGGVGSDLAASG